MIFLRVFLVAATFFSLSAFSLSSPAQARIEECPRHNPITELRARRDKTIFQRGSVAAINTYLNNHDPASNGVVLAFVEYGSPDTLDVQTEYRFSMTDIGHGRYCVMLDRVRSFFYARPKLVMPSNFRKNSCEYKHILEHEKRHLNALYEFHESNTSKYRTYLGMIARNVPIGKPVTNEDEAEEVKQAIADYFSEKFYEQVGISLAELQEVQRNIDTQQEYIGVSRRLQRCEQERAAKTKSQKVFR